jgi:hypothetical protein
MNPEAVVKGPELTECADLTDRRINEEQADATVEAKPRAEALRRGARDIG